MSYREPNTEIRMQRITITIEDDLLAEIDAAAEARGYQNRSEIIRDLARAGLQQGTEETAPSGQCVAALVYVYDHAARDLARPHGGKALLEPVDGKAVGDYPADIEAVLQHGNHLVPGLEDLTPVDPLDGDRLEDNP